MPTSQGIPACRREPHTQKMVQPTQNPQWLFKISRIRKLSCILRKPRYRVLKKKLHNKNNNNNIQRSTTVPYLLTYYQAELTYSK